MKKDDQRVKITKMMIKNSFIDLLATKPIQNITVKELCEKAEINRGTFYKHYLDVYDLKEKIEEEFAEKLIVALTPLSQKNGNEASLTNVISTVFNVIHNNADFSSLLVSQNSDKTFIVKLLSIGYKNYIDAYLKIFPNVSETKLNYYYSFISGGCVGVLEKWLINGMKEDISELSAFTENIIMTGIGFLKDNWNILFLCRKEKTLNQMV